MAWLLYLLLAWAEVNASSRVKRVIGGHVCGPDERHYHVKLEPEYKITNIKKVLSVRGNCGGSLISSQWILTAEHCWPTVKNEPALVAGSVEMYAVLGVHPKGSKHVKIIIPEDHKFPHDKHDIMLLKLPQDKGLHTVSLPDCSLKPALGDDVQIAGYGWTQVDPKTNKKVESQTPVTDLQCGVMKVADCTDARISAAIISRLPHRVATGKWICASSAKVDTCRGDSGGGVIHNKQLYGVISNGGIKACTKAAAFMDVCEYKSWIEEIQIKWGQVVRGPG